MSTELPINQNEGRNNSEKNPPTKPLGPALGALFKEYKEYNEKTLRNLKYQELGGEDGIKNNILKKIKFGMKYESQDKDLEFARIKEAAQKQTGQISSLIRDGYWYATSSQISKDDENTRFVFLYNPDNKETPTKILALKLEPKIEVKTVDESQIITEVRPISESETREWARQNQEELKSTLNTLTEQWEYRNNDSNYRSELIATIKDYVEFECYLKKQWDDKKQILIDTTWLFLADAGFKGDEDAYKKEIDSLLDIKDNG